VGGWNGKPAAVGPAPVARGGRDSVERSGVVRIETYLAKALKGAAGKLVGVADFVTTLKWA
jgi:hypothetical protein